MIWRTLKWLVTPQRTPLAARQPRIDRPDVPLGLEAIDTRLIEQVNRRNHALERTYNMAPARGRRWGAIENADTDAAVQFADDETYASRFHAAFQKDKTQ